jgi:hypothetical protein
LGTVTEGRTDVASIGGVLGVVGVLGVLRVAWRRE